MIIKDWRLSTALTPDLLPRVAFSVDEKSWQNILWLLQGLVGPNCLAIRPRLWRARCMMVTYKRGPPDQGSSYRLLAVLTQHALLQEGILAKRIRPQIWSSLQPVQGGYIRDSLDTVLCLHELSANYVACDRCLITVHGDLVHAFPRTWREELVVLLRQVVNDGVLAEVGSILEWDEWMSGCCLLVVSRGRQSCRAYQRGACWDRCSSISFLTLWRWLCVTQGVELRGMLMYHLFGKGMCGLALERLNLLSSGLSRMACAVSHLYHR